MDRTFPTASAGTCWMVLLRHGATPMNRVSPPRLQGRQTDLALTDEGLAQARAAAEFLAPVRVDRVYSSPLLRARQTAEAVAAPHGIAVEPVELLIEADVGEWEGMTWEEAERHAPEAYRAFVRDAGENPYLGGESLGQVRRRVVSAFERLLAENEGRVIAVVAHNVVNRCYLAELLGVPLANYRAVAQSNCGVNLIRHRNGQTRVVTLNAVFHLADDGL